ncbi:hypothetical protein ACP70R_038635 [Stipagrostis hirtigluma subsp. patula]
MDKDDDDESSAGAGAGGRVLEWELGLPTASELTPVSHPLIPPALAAAFRIDITGVFASSAPFDCPLAHDSPTSHLSFRCEEDDEDYEEEGEGETEDPAPGASVCRDRRAGKKARMVWTPELHHRFVEAVAHLGDRGAVPKAIVRLMNVEGLTRENVASHLQKYRLYLKRTRSPAAPTPTPSRSPAYVSPFSPEPPQKASNRCGYFAFLSRDSEQLERQLSIQRLCFSEGRHLGQAWCSTVR